VREARIEMQKATNEWYSGVREVSSEEEIMEDDEEQCQHEQQHQFSHSEPINSNSTETTEL